MSNLVLLLEDEPLIRDLVCTLLTDAGCGVLVCDSLERLTDVAAETPWAVALADFWGESHHTLNDVECAQIVQLAQTVLTTRRSARECGWSRLADVLVSDAT